MPGAYAIPCAPERPAPVRRRGAPRAGRPNLDDALRGVENGVDDPQCHVLVTRIDLCILNLDAPNRGEVGSNKYEHKLVWYRRRDTRCDPALPIVLRGDLSVAPEDRDVWDPERRRGQTLCSESERAAVRTLVTWRLRDALRLCHPETSRLYTCCDYPEGGASSRVHPSAHAPFVLALAAP